MATLLIYIAIVGLLFAVAFINKRHFGLLGLALAAGSILSGIWSYEASLVPGVFGASTGSYTVAIASTFVILLPAGVLMFHGHKYKTLVGRVVGAGLFAILASAFLIEPLSQVFVAHGLGSNVILWLISNRMTIIGVGLVIAVVEIFLSKPVRVPERRRKR